MKEIKEIIKKAVDNCQYRKKVSPANYKLYEDSAIGSATNTINALFEKKIKEARIREVELAMIMIQDFMVKPIEYLDTFHRRIAQLKGTNEETQKTAKT